MTLNEALKASIDRQDSALCLLDIEGTLALFTVTELKTAVRRAQGWERRPRDWTPGTGDRKTY
jgi:hypothetical protein